MVKPTVRRSVDPQLAIKFWDAINFIRQQKQIPNEERIQRYMKRTHEMSYSDCSSNLKSTVQVKNTQ